MGGRLVSFTGATGFGLRARLLAATVATTLLSPLTAVASADAAVGVPTTYEGPSYASTVVSPSADKPQSKLWYVDGSWWALMSTGADTRTRIHQLLPDHTWRDTGTVVDTRLNSTGDALWSAAAGKLFVASRTASTNLQVARFSYNTSANTWSVDTGFPVVVNTGGGSESATIDQDSSGRLWVTYTRASRLWIAQSDVTGSQWTAGFQPNVGDVTIKADDISALISFRNSIGLLWSDQQSGAVRFAIHEDDDPTSLWRVEDAGVAIPGASVADDHINLKQLTSDSRGRIFAAVKTSNDLGGANAALVGVLVRTPGANDVGTWEFVVAGTVADDHTRPIIMIDETNQELYFFATAPGGDIVYKKTSLTNPSFAPGRGTAFVDSTASVNNASGSKDPVNASTGMVVLAGADGPKRYVHAEMSLDAVGPGPGDTVSPSVPQGLVASVVSGGVDLSWSASVDDVGVVGYVVRRDGVVLDQVAGTSFSDRAVAPGGRYGYTVEAVDAAGNRSGQSGVVSVDVPGEPPPPSGEGIVFRAGSTADNADGDSALVIAAPSHQAGDVLLATVDYRGAAVIAAVPAGWQLVRTDLNGTAVRKATYVRVAGGSEPASYVWGFDRRPSAVGSILAYSGVSGSTPVEASSGRANAASKLVTAPSVTTTSPGALVVGLFTVNKRAGLTPPTGMVERSEVSSPAAVTYPVTGESADLVRASAGASGDKAATSTLSGASIGQQIALTPAG